MAGKDEEMNRAKGLTRKELCKETGAPPYTVDYLNSLGRLPLIREARPGRSNLYAPESIEIVKEHLGQSDREAVSQ